VAGLAGLYLAFAAMMASPLTGARSTFTIIFGVGSAAGAAAAAVLAFGWVRLRWFEWLGAALFAAAGTAAGLLEERVTGCCLFQFGLHRGFPLAWRHEWMDFERVVSSDAARAAMATRPDLVFRTVDPWYLVADLVWWASVAVAVLVVVHLLARAWLSARQERRGAGPGGASITSSQDA